ncbi:MAG: hypothetical protein JRH20_19925 [Deltaproteobacteria bacterium]|nr:hypothetical protein [Deltaproteobacteria bacterium]
MVHDCLFTNNIGPESGAACGGAIGAEGKGSTVIVDSIITDNSAANGGGVCAVSGSMAASLTIVGSTISRNMATGWDGIAAEGGDGGGVHHNGGALSICNSRIASNEAGYISGGIHRVPGLVNAPVLISRCTIMSNSSERGGGGFLRASALRVVDSVIVDNTARVGGGLMIGEGSLDLTNVTIAGNTSTYAGGGLHVSGVAGGSLLNVTLANNTANFGGAIYSDGNQLWLKNSVIADNRAIFEDPSCYGVFSDGGGNLQFPNMPRESCALGITFADPGLSPLGDNGGGTLTMAVDASSPAVGIGKQCPPTDQRGVSRADPCTSGAYEFQSP